MDASPQDLLLCSPPHPLIYQISKVCEKKLKPPWLLSVTYIAEDGKVPSAAPYSSLDWVTSNSKSPNLINQTAKTDTSPEHALSPCAKDRLSRSKNSINGSHKRRKCMRECYSVQTKTELNRPFGFMILVRYDFSYFSFLYLCNVKFYLGMLVKSSGIHEMRNVVKSPSRCQTGNYLNHGESNKEDKTIRHSITQMLWRKCWDRY